MLRLLLCAMGTFLVTSVASAQPAPPVGGAASRPAFSPYLNLVNRGNNPGLNYLGIIRPQQQLAQQFNQLQQQTFQAASSLQSDLNNLALGADPFLPQTGLVGRFDVLSPYYTRNPSRGGGGGGLGGTSFGGIGGGGGIGSLGSGRIGAPPQGGAGLGGGGMMRPAGGGLGGGMGGGMMRPAGGGMGGGLGGGLRR